MGIKIEIEEPGPNTPIPECRCGNVAQRSASSEDVLILALDGFGAVPTCELCVLKSRLSVAEKLAAEIEDLRYRILQQADDLTRCRSCGHTLAWHRLKNPRHRFDPDLRREI